MSIFHVLGICEVKYRSQEQKTTMHRLDSNLVELDEMLSTMNDPANDPVGYVSCLSIFLVCKNFKTCFSSLGLMC